jgi:hypothetical protein
MPCYNPLLAYKCDGKVVFNKPFAIAKGFNLPCGQCIGCRLDYSRQWAIRCVHEAQMHKDNCFITLTFNPEELEKREKPFSLDKTEFQRFMKRLRKKMGQKVRFFHCGEYGDKNKRPHYHALLFGVDFYDKKLFQQRDGIRLYTSELLQELWPYGFSTIGEVNFLTAAYCARYVMKKITGEAAEEHYQYTCPETGEVYTIQPEYCTMSRRGGIGETWYEKYGWHDCHKHDFVVVNGHEVRPPRYYDKLLDKKDTSQYLQIKEARQSAISEVYDKYDEKMDRLWVKEEVKLRKLELLVRNL